MSLVAYAWNYSKRSDIQQKTTYSVFYDTVSQSLVGDPSASIQIIGNLFYLLIEGKYKNFIEPASSEYGQIVDFRGTISSTVANFNANAGYVAQWFSNPAAIQVLPSQTLVVFGCVKALDNSLFVPEVGVWIDIDIAQLPQQPVTVQDV